MRARSWFGFTLIEAMMVVAVIAILATIAYPSYQGQIYKAKRSDAQAALLRIQLEQEKWRANRISYAQSLSDLGLSVDSPDGHYQLAIIPDSATPTGFIATARAQGAQAGDAGCGVITLAVDAGGERFTPEACW